MNRDALVAEMKSMKEIQAPEWAVFVKTGAHKERPPVQDDWWHIRAASVLLKVHKFGPVGTNKLAKQYGGRKNRGHKKDIKVSGSRNIVRKCLQQLEAAGLLAKSSTTSAGRVLSAKGKEVIKKVSEE